NERWCDRRETAGDARVRSAPLPQRKAFRVAHTHLPPDRRIWPHGPHAARVAEALRERGSVKGDHRPVVPLGRPECGTRGEEGVRDLSASRGFGRDPVKAPPPLQLLPWQSPGSGVSTAVAYAASRGPDRSRPDRSFGPNSSLHTQHSSLPTQHSSLITQHSPHTLFAIGFVGS